MYDLKNVMISWFSNVKSTEPYKTSMFNWLNSDVAKVAVENFRKIPDKELRRFYKEKMPAATLSGLFTKRNLAGFVQHSGFMCIDIDFQDNDWITDIEDFKKELSKVINMVYVGLSIGGKGVFCIIPIQYPEKHKEHFEAFKRDFEEIGIIIDKSCGDVTRLRILSYDVNAYYNENAVVYSKLIEKTKVQIPQKGNRRIVKSFFNKPVDNMETFAKVQLIIADIESCLVDITGDYKQWFEIGCALANEFGENGRSMFHEVSQFSEKYIESKTDEQFTSCLNGKYPYTIGTFFKFAKEELDNYKYYD